MGQKFFKVWLHYKPILSLTKYYKIEQDLIINGVFNIADDIYSKNLLDLTENKRVDNLEESVKKQKNFIDIIMDNRDVFTKEEVRDEINTMLFAVRIFCVDLTSCIATSFYFSGFRYICLDNGSNTVDVSYA